MLLQWPKRSLNQMPEVSARFDQPIQSQTDESFFTELLLVVIISSRKSIGMMYWYKINVNPDHRSPTQALTLCGSRAFLHDIFMSPIYFIFQEWLLTTTTASRLLLYQYRLANSCTYYCTVANLPCYVQTSTTVQYIDLTSISRICVDW